MAGSERITESGILVVSYAPEIVDIKRGEAILYDRCSDDPPPDDYVATIRNRWRTWKIGGRIPKSMSDHDLRALITRRITEER